MASVVIKVGKVISVGLVILLLSDVRFCSSADHINIRSMSSHDAPVNKRDVGVQSKGTKGTTSSNSIKNTNGAATPTTPTIATTKATSPGPVNCSLPSNANKTECTKNSPEFIKKVYRYMSDNSGMLFRTMYVLLGITGIVIVYFIVRAVSLRRRRSKSRKYGIITNRGDHGDMEMEPLGDGEDEDDDYTLYEMNGRKK